MSDIFEEVDEDIRRDNAAALWAKYQNLVYGVVALLILGTAGITGWEIYQRNAREKAGAEYLQALQRSQQDPKAAGDALGTLIHQDGPFADLARFDLAQAAIKEGDKAKALDLLTAMANDAELETPLKGAASVMGGYIALDLGKAETATALVTPLTSKDHPYRFSATEIMGLAAYASGNKAKAKEIFTKLDEELKQANGSAGIPVNLQNRVVIMLDRLAG